MTRQTRLLISLLALGFARAHSLAAQAPSPSVTAGFGVDTTVSDVGKIFSLVRAYLSQPDSVRSRGLWSTATEFDRTIGDITALIPVNPGVPATVIGIIPAAPGDSLYTLRILYATADSAGRVSPLGLQRLYAVREPGARYGFRLSSAFPRMRRDWEQRSRGPLTFWYYPGQRPNQSRIDATARFVDSAAALLTVPVPRHLDVIVGKSYEEVLRAIGVDFYPVASSPMPPSAGLSIGSIILSGNPAIGEAYFHELVHSILGPAIHPGNRLLSEGIATWLGGSRGRTPRELYALLRDYQRADSTLSLSSLIRSGFEDKDVDRGANLLYGSAALIADSIYRRGGIAPLLTAYRLKNEPDTLVRGISVALGLSPTDTRSLDAWWRAESARAARNAQSR